MRVDATSYEDAFSRLVLHRAAQSGLSGYVCAATVHMAKESYDSTNFQRILNGAYLVVPDGRPLVRVLGALRVKHATQMRGTA